MCLRTADFIMFEATNAGSWHNRFPGETRVQLNLAGLVSFYDTGLAPSLVDIRAGQERWDHRAQNISSEDLSAVKSRLEAILSRPSGLSSGIDWRTLVQVIVDRYAGRLELTRYLLNSSMTGPDEILDLAKKTQTQLRTMLTPYILFSVTPTDRSDKDELDWTIPIYKLCATTHTHSMESHLDSDQFREVASSSCTTDHPRDLPRGDEDVGRRCLRWDRPVVKHKGISRHCRGSSPLEYMDGGLGPPNGMARLGRVGQVQSWLWSRGASRRPVTTDSYSMIDEWSAGDVLLAYMTYQFPSNGPLPIRS